MSEKFTRTAAAIADGCGRHLHSGVQLYVSLEGEVLVDEAFGDGLTPPPITQNSLMLWRSAGKPLTAALVVMLAQQNRMTLEDPVSRWIPEAGMSPVGEIMLRDLLSHRSGLPILDTGWPQASWEQIIAKVIAVEQLTTTAAYQPQSSWFLLAEVAQRVTGKSFQQLMREELLQPLQLDQTWCGLPADVVQQSDRVAEIYERAGGRLRPASLSDPAALTSASPGGNFRGPVSQLAGFYEWLAGIRVDERAPSAADVYRQMTTPIRTGQFDETLQHTIDFGLGLILNSNQYGPQTVPYGFGRFSSDRAFGHGGAQCAIGFCDPEFQLVVAWAANGLCGEGWHQRRNRAINEAIYEDLGLC